MDNLEGRIFRAKKSFMKKNKEFHNIDLCAEFDCLLNGYYNMDDIRLNVFLDSFDPYVSREKKLKRILNYD